MTMMAPDIWGSITSIGRVITPVYPLALVYSASRDTIVSRVIAAMILLIGIVTALGLALIAHPFILAS